MRFQRSINVSVNKTGAIHLRMFAGFLFNNIFCAATNLAASIKLPNSRNEEMMGDGFFGATAAGLFEQ